ncbi:MAG: hypothetical protein NC089_13505 [Bacteroides sp.]|nr:hypothetical protein [Bacteroides sp.]MCM1550295.1 hypothetical protein [Clostridium sp.]
MRRRWNRKEVMWLGISVLLAVFCMILPGILVNAQAERNKNTVHQASASYYSSRTQTAVQMTLYERMKLISGEWESNWAEVNQQEMQDISKIPEASRPNLQSGQGGDLELTGYCYMDYQSVLEHVEEELKVYYEVGFYPENPESTYSNWYRPTVKLYQFSDAIFDSYICYVWLVELEYYDGSMRHTVLLDDTSGMILAAGIQGEDYRLDTQWRYNAEQLPEVSDSLLDYYHRIQPVQSAFDITGTNGYQPQYELWNTAYGLTAGQKTGSSPGLAQKQVLLSASTDIASYTEAIREVKNIVNNDKFIYSLRWNDRQCWFSLSPFTVQLEQEGVE